MTSLNLQEALREPSANAASVTNPQPSMETTAPDVTPSAIAPANGQADKDRGGYVIGADDSFWVYRPKARAKPAVRDPGPAAIAPAVSKTGQSGLSLREAAAMAGASKSTILRAIQSGRLAAPKTGDGSYAIERAALLAVFPSKSGDGAVEPSGKAGSRAVKTAASRHGAETTPGPDVLAARMAALEVEIKNLKALLGDVNPPRTWWRKIAG